MVKIIANSSEFNKEIQGPGLVVVDYFADWCGPCRQITPFVESLSTKYPHVKFLKVNADQSEISQQRGIKSLPTFQFFVKGSQVDEIKGANPSLLEQKVNQWKVDAAEPFAGRGFALGAGAGSADQDFREARLRAFQAAMPSAANRTHSAPATSSSFNAQILAHNSDGDAVDEDLALAQAMAMSMAEEHGSAVAPITANTTSLPSHPYSANTKSVAQQAQDASDWAEAEAEQLVQQQADDKEWGDEMVPVPVNQDILTQMEEMGVPEVRARKSIVHGGSLEGALAWLEEHQNDVDIDQPYMVKKSDTIPKPVLTEEEKNKKIAEIQEKIKKRKEEKLKAEREAEIKREKERRERGQKVGEIQEERDRAMRKREAERAKKEKLEAEKEKARIKAEIARDRELRRLNNGVLPSVLGVDGYNPSAVRYDGGGSMDVDIEPSATAVSVVASAATPSNTTSSTTRSIVSKPASSSTNAPLSAKAAAFEALSPEVKIDSAIQTISKYRTAGAGGHALKLLYTFVKNVAEQPDELKFRSINTESAAYKQKLSPLVGPSIVLKALGFIKTDDGKLKLDGDVNLEIFRSATEKLRQAEAQFNAAGF